MLEIIIIALALITGTEWLVGKLAKRPDGGFRLVSAGCGSLLAIGMVVMLVQVLADPKGDFMAAVVSLPWIAIGVMLVVKAIKNR
jgi:hypothetical protein